MSEQNKRMSYSADELKKLKPEFMKKYVMNLQGKDFMTYNGLIELAKEKGLKELKVDIIQFPNASNYDTAIAQATAVGYEVVNGENVEVTYIEVGDANASNCNKMVGKHYIRMAATRAKGRALRDFLGIDMVMSEELGGDAYEDNDPAKKGCTQAQMEKIGALMTEGGISKEEMRDLAKQVCGTPDVKTYTMAMADHLIKALIKEVEFRAAKNQ